MFSKEKQQELLAAAHKFLETMQQDKLAEEICMACSRILGADTTHLYLIEGETFLLQEIGGLLGTPLIGGDAEDNLLVEHGRIVTPELEAALNRVLQGPAHIQYGFAPTLFPNQFTAAIPLQHRGRSLGVLVLVDNDRTRLLSPAEEELLRELAVFAAQALSIEHVIGERESRDGLTGLYNQKYFKKAVRREIERVRRYGGVVCLAMIDIDRFKHVNDTWGHLTGDDVLKGVARFISSDAVRLTDVASRYGGEEFAVLLVHTPLDGAVAYAESLRAEVAAVQTWPRRITISCGVAELREDSAALPHLTSDAFIHRADRALYEAKQRGRDRVVAVPD